MRDFFKTGMRVPLDWCMYGSQHRMVVLLLLRRHTNLRCRCDPREFNHSHSGTGFVPKWLPLGIVPHRLQLRSGFHASGRVPS